MNIFTRFSPESITLTMPYQLREFLRDAATLVKTSVADQASPGYQRVCSPIDPSMDDDDPLARLERQVSVEADASDMLESIYSTSLTNDQAESWLRVLTMSSAIRAHIAGVYCDDDMANLDPFDAAAFSVTTYLQVSLANALDESADPC